MAAEGLLELLEDISGEGAACAAFLQGDATPARDHLLVRLDPDKGIAANVLSAFNRLQQEGFGLFGCDSQERGDGCLEVGCDGSVDRDQRMSAAQLKEVCGGRRCVVARS